MRAGTADTLLRPVTEPHMISDHVEAEKASLRAAHFNALLRNASISNNDLEERMLRSGGKSTSTPAKAGSAS